MLCSALLEELDVAGEVWIILINATTSFPKSVWIVPETLALI